VRNESMQVIDSGTSASGREDDGKNEVSRVMVCKNERDSKNSLWSKFEDRLKVISAFHSIIVQLGQSLDQPLTAV
jgi:uncharacterized protein YifE (UPF0438 family)